MVRWRFSSRLEQTTGGGPLSHEQPRFLASVSTADRAAASFEERNGTRCGVGRFEMTLNASRGSAAGPLAAERRDVSETD